MFQRQPTQGSGDRLRLKTNEGEKLGRLGWPQEQEEWSNLRRCAQRVTRAPTMKDS